MIALTPPPPLPSGVKCTYAVQSKVPAASVVRHGLAVKVTCNGPARVGIGAELHGRKIEHYLATRYSGGYPGDALIARPRAVGAGTTTLRATVMPWARRPMLRLTPMTAGIRLMSRRTDGYYWSFGAKRIRVTR